MTWIKHPASEADPRYGSAMKPLTPIYPPEYGGEVPAVRAIRTAPRTASSASHSLIPEALRHALSTLGVLIAPELPLRRASMR